MTFKVDPDTHIDSLEKAEDNVLEGTSHWSCKIATTGQAKHVHTVEDGSMEAYGSFLHGGAAVALYTSILPLPTTQPTSATPL